MQSVGPSIGFGTTTLALCDVTYAVPEATFTTPFMKLGNQPFFFFFFFSCLTDMIRILC